MNERYLLIGTAGHVDHGKTQLVQALTGINTDRLKEEKDRGISIELGFAHLTLPDGRMAGIVDVPGHERFVRQMLAGASGMDVVLLVIAADEGVMPQTEEHLAILDLLQLNKGIVVLTKIDLVDEEWLCLVEQDIREKLKGSFLENAPFCKVSSVTGEGIPQLVQTIEQVLTKAETRRTDLPARMPIDRVFSIQGFGTVVTGTLHSGLFQRGQDIQIEPGGIAAKIRNIQVHGVQVDKVLAGQRAALNLSGLAVGEIARGSTLVVPEYFTVGQILDVEITNLAGEKRVIKHRQRIHFHLGTAEKLGRIHLLAQEELHPGETGYAQVILEGPILAVKGDRFVIRYYSPVTTIGGGTVLGLASAKRKRFREKVLEELRLKAKGSLQELIGRELNYPKTLNEIQKITGLGKEEIEKAVKSLEDDNLVVILAEDDARRFWLGEAANQWGQKASVEAAQFQKLYPLRGGIGREQLKKQLEMNVSLKTWQGMLEWGAENGFLRIIGNQVETLPERGLPEKINRQINCLLDRWEKAELNPPDWQEVAAACGLPQDKSQEYAGYLMARGMWIKIGEYYFATSSIEKAKEALRKYLEEKGQVTVSEARDLWQTSRKYAVPLLEYLDSIRFTKRDGVIRYLNH